MLDPRAIAVGGAGYGTRSLAVLGLWPGQGVAASVPRRRTGGPLIGTGSGRPSPRENDEALIISLLL